MKYKIKLTLAEQYETEIEASSEDEARAIADNMDIDEFDETGITTINYSAIERG